ncbi:hypothetical protein CSOJ01_04996 [Colletotrichum sojae]|uniref:Uncharacterized protein n=1 Tax=Colletotrichum sojae TaxID=2175907 RepID=A0A8H6JHN5_9PEZI|nr:hypothetical protein CSOJ01_04996 [Colletotrichum sojae]
MSSSFEAPSVLVRITSEFAVLFAGAVTKLPLVSTFFRQSASGNLQIARSRVWFDMIDVTICLWRPSYVLRVAVCVPGSRQRSAAMRHGSRLLCHRATGPRTKSVPQATRRDCTFCHAWEHEPRQAAGRYRRPYHATSKLLFARLDTMNDTLRMAGDALQAALLHCCGMQVWYVRQAGPNRGGAGTDYSTLQLATETSSAGQLQSRCGSWLSTWGGLGAWQGNSVAAVVIAAAILRHRRHTRGMLVRELRRCGANLPVQSKCLPVLQRDTAHHGWRAGLGSRGELGYRCSRSDGNQVSVGEARQTTQRRLKTQKAVAGMQTGGSITVTAAGAGDFDLHAANLVAPVTPPDTVIWCLSLEEQIESSMFRSLRGRSACSAGAGTALTPNNMDFGLRPGCADAMTRAKWNNFPHPEKGSIVVCCKRSMLVPRPSTANGERSTVDLGGLVLGSERFLERNLASPVTGGPPTPPPARPAAMFLQGWDCGTHADPQSRITIDSTTCRRNGG